MTYKGKKKIEMEKNEMEMEKETIQKILFFLQREIPDFLKEWIKECDQRYAEEFFEIGLAYEREEKWDKMIESYKRAIDGGNIPSMIRLASFYEKENDRISASLRDDRDVSASLRDDRVVSASLPNDRDVSASLRDDRDVSSSRSASRSASLRDDRDALENVKYYYTMAFEMGENRGIRHLAYYYQDRLEDEENAIACFEKGALAGDSLCADSLGRYWEARGEKEKAISYYEKANNDRAFLLCANYYNEKKNELKEIEFLEKIEDMTEECILRLADFFYYYSKTHTEEYIQKMLKYNKKGAEYKYINSMANLGRYYENKGDIENMLLYAKKGSELEMETRDQEFYCTYLLGNYYKKIDNTTEMLRYYKMIINEGGSDCEELYGDIHMSIADYYKEKKDIPNMIKFLEESNYDISIYILAKHYEEVGNIPEMLNCYYMILKDNSVYRYPYFCEPSFITKSINSLLSYYSKKKEEREGEENEMEKKTYCLQDKQTYADLHRLLNFIIECKDETLFLSVQKRFKLKKFNSFYQSRKKYISKNEECSDCKTIQNIFPMDCFCSKICLMCYFHKDKCELCDVKKHPEFCNFFN